MYTGELTSSERAAATKRWKDGLQSQDQWMIATEAFGQGVDYPHVRCTIHENPKALLNWVQETGRAGRDRGTAICYTVWSELPWPIRKGDLDHQGRMEMHRVAHSCVSLDGELCSNCERSAKIPYHLALQGQANFNKRLIPIDPKDSLSLLMPVSVQTNAAEVHAEREAGYGKLLELHRILDRASRHGCLDCFVNDADHDASMVHNWDWMFTLYLGQLKLKYDPNPNWPFCWVCWVPFRKPCNHVPTRPGKEHDTSLCLYQTTHPVTGEYTPIVPTLIALIFRYMACHPNADQCFVRLANELQIGVDQVKGLNKLGPWLKKPVLNISDIPNHSLYLIAWYKVFRGLLSATIISELSLAAKTRFVSLFPYLIMPMYFEEFPCPLCPEALRTAELLYDHVVGHRESSRSIVRASIHDRDVLIAKASSLDILYACPLCTVSGPLGAVCLHYLNTHTSSTSSKSPVPDSMRDYPSKRKRSLSPAHFSLSSSSSSPSLASSSTPLPFAPLYPCLNHPKPSVRTLLPACTVEIDISAVISSHPTPEKFFHFVGFSLGNVRSSFGQHPDCAPCHKDEREDWKSWLLSLPFLIYETRALREPIFGFLGLSCNSFPTVKEYAGWIVTRAIPSEEQATNLILIVGELIMPLDGHTMEGPSSSPLSAV
ncbi:hypothetical protein GGU11DRAFT_758305 [Lentinula aff. detonsa]|nr:hypothetical protein GGU11DRAFT_758305 [Lentinula aff. detonsa]